MARHSTAAGDAEELDAAPALQNYRERLRSRLKGQRPRGKLPENVKEARIFLRECIDDPVYRRGFLARLRAGKLPPQLEVFAWSHAVGRAPLILEHTGAKGGPIQVTAVPLASLTDTQLDAIRAALEAANRGDRPALPDAKPAPPAGAEPPGLPVLDVAIGAAVREVQAEGESLTPEDEYPPVDTSHFPEQNRKVAQTEERGESRHGIGGIWTGEDGGEGREP